MLFDIVIFPVIDWRYRFQRPQHLAREFARRGHRVFYIANTFVPELCVCDPQAEEVENNVFRVVLPGSENPPDIYRDIPDPVQIAALVNGVRRLREQYGIGAVLSIVEYPFWAPVVRRLSNHVVLYDCMDDYGSFANAGRPAAELEAEIVREADLVVCSSMHLQHKFAGRDTLLVRNAVDAGHFEHAPPRLAIECNGRTAGYWGATAEWTDIELLVYAARALPTVRFVIVGEVMRIDVSELASLPNVIMTGEAPYDDLPAYLHAFDVCLLPYRVCDYARASDPMKVWEYLAGGKPVVAVRFPEIERLDGIIALTATQDEFVSEIRAALDARDDDGEYARREFARRNSWGMRCEQIRAAAAPFFPKVSVIVLAHNQCSFTKACLHGIERFSAYPNLELVVVDNASSDDTPEFLRECRKSRPWVKVVTSAINGGFSAGNNLGARVAAGDYLVFLNNDCFVTDGWIGDMLRHFREVPELGLLGPVTNSSGNESVIDIEYQTVEEMAVKARHYTRRHLGMRTHPGVLHWFCVMLPRRVWDEVGELDEGFGLGFFEDDDYTLRVRAAGYQTACAEDVFVHHHQSASFGRLPRATYDRIFQQSRRYFESKWGPWTPPVFREEVRVKCSR